MSKRWMLTLALLILPRGEALWAQPSPGGIILGAIKARGGADKLDQYPAARARIRATIDLNGRDVSAQIETVVQLPNQFKNVLQLEVDGKKHFAIQALNGDKGWMNLDGTVRDMTDTELGALKESFYAEQAGRLTPLVRDRNYELRPLDEIRVDNRPALGVKVSYKGRPDLALYFDKGTGLLVKSERRLVTPDVKEQKQEEIFRDYKDVKGVLRPTKIAVYRDGKRFMEGEIVEYVPLDKVDPKEFAKP